MSVPGLDRGIAILRLFRRDRRTLSAPQIAAELGLPRSTAYRLITTLIDLDLLCRHDDNRYALSVGVLTLGHECLASMDIVGLANSILPELRDETGWSTHLAVLHERSVVYLARHVSRAAVTSNVSVGSSLPAHATIMGRVLLGGMSSVQLRALYSDVEMKRHGADTPANIDELERLVTADRNRGYAVAKNYYQRGVVAVAAPVRDASHHVVAAINAIAPSSEQTDANLERTTAAVIRAALRMSSDRGGEQTVARVHAGHPVSVGALP